MKTIRNQFRKYLSFAVTLTLITILAIPTQTSAVTPINSYTENGFLIEETLTVDSESNHNGISTFSTGQRKTATTTYKIKDDSGTVLGTFALKGIFTYGTSAPAKCESATCSTSVNDSHCKFTAKAAYSSGNQAIGTFTFTYSLAGITRQVSDTVKITCSVNGTIS